MGHPLHAIPASPHAVHTCIDQVSEHTLSVSEDLSEGSKARAASMWHSWDLPTPAQDLSVQATAALVWLPQSTTCWPDNLCDGPARDAPLQRLV